MIALPHFFQFLLLVFHIYEHGPVFLFTRQNQKFTRNHFLALFFGFFLGQKIFFSPTFFPNFLGHSVVFSGRISEFFLGWILFFSARNSAIFWIFTGIILLFFSRALFFSQAVFEIFSRAVSKLLQQKIENFLGEKKFFLG